MPGDRAAIVQAATAWIGTPYHHQAAVRGVGCDCLGLVRGVWRDLFGDEPERPPVYSADWGEHGLQEFLLQAARRNLVEIDPAAFQAGDVLCFRMRPGAMAKHLAIVADANSMIHAAAREVCLVRLAPYWRRHLVAAFSFPGIAD